MNLRNHNEASLASWLDKDYPDRIQGRMPQDTVLESRKLEGSVILKKAAYESIDALYQARRPDASDFEKRRARTDSILLYLADRYLREKAEDTGQAKYHLMHRAARTILLGESQAGGYIELERLEERGKNNSTIAVVAYFAREAFEEILNELDRAGFRLEVARDQRARNKREAFNQDRRILVNDSYRKLAEERRILVCQGMSASDADKEVARKNDISPRKVREAVKFVREELSTAS